MLLVGRDGTVQMTAWCVEHRLWRASASWLSARSQPVHGAEKIHGPRRVEVLVAPSSKCLRAAAWALAEQVTGTRLAPLGLLPAVEHLQSLAETAEPVLVSGCFPVVTSPPPVTCASAIVGRLVQVVATVTGRDGRVPESS